MPKFLKTLLTFLLAVVITLPSLGVVEAKEINDIQSSLQQSDYTVIEKDNSSYGEVYYVVEKHKLRERSFWDVVDVVMAGVSWADFFKDPSWSNLGWAVLDTASILPLLPSTAYVRKGGKILLKIDEVAKFAKTSKGKQVLKSAMKIHKLANVTYDLKQVQKKFKHAADFGIKGSYNSINAKQFLNALKNVVNNPTEVYKSTYHSKDVIVYIKNGLGVLTEIDGKFISGWKLSSDQLKFHRSKLKIK